MLGALDVVYTMHLSTTAYVDGSWTCVVHPYSLESPNPRLLDARRSTAGITESWWMVMLGSRDGW